ncbi:MAG: hypothetical protein M3Z32_02870, partial [Acidobacteriota bacterium]|nr:hypothetical protein [Acidobacteriota bacterium]
MIANGKQIFRFDTFGDEAFWGDTLKLHQAIEGSRFGGVGPGVSPKTALALGLDDPAFTLTLLKLNSVVGVTGFFNPDGSLKSMGTSAQFCHSTVDRSFTTPGIPPGNIGIRQDGWANRDLNVGAIIASPPDVSAATKLLGADDAT